MSATVTGASFASDNHAGIHPDVLAAVVAANEGYAVAYGDDPITAEAVRLFRHELGDHVDAFPVFNGTGANVVALAAMTTRFGSVVCTSTAPIHVDAGGPPDGSFGLVPFVL